MEPFALLLVSLLARDWERALPALASLVARYGPLCRLSRPLSFDWTDYYAEEMGGPLQRRVAVFAQPVAMGRLAGAKRFCMGLEERYAANGKRLVNLDPGLLHEGGLILASAKWAPHRLPLCRSELFAELTLHYAGGCYNALPWTYRDYAERPLNPLFRRLRERLLWLRANQAKANGETPC